MTYGPPPNQGWQQPPPGYGQPGYGPPPQQPPGYGYGPQRPPLPGVVVLLGILAILLGLSEIVFGPHGSVVSLPIRVISMLVLVIGGIMALTRRRAGAILISVGATLVILYFVLALAVPNVLMEHRLVLEAAHDWPYYVRTAAAVVVLIISMLPPVTRALSGQSGPPPGHGPAGYGPAGYGQQPPTWR